MITENLKRYYAYFKKVESEQPVRGWIAGPTTIKTLWIPQWSGNRSATIDLNHQVVEMDENYLWGENGNCCTPYIILEVPLQFTDEHLAEIGEKIWKEAGSYHPSWHYALKTSRIDKIMAELKTMFPNFYK